MNEKTKAIVLHHIKHTDSSVILHLYTEKFGRLAFVVNGIHSKRAKVKASMLAPLSLIEIDFNHSDKNSLHRIADAKVIRSFSCIPFDPSRSALSFFIAEVINRTQHDALPDHDVFSLIYNSIIKLDSPETHIGNFHILFLINYSRALGFAPHSESYAEGSMFDMLNGSFQTPAASSKYMLDSDESAAIKALLSLSYDTSANIAIGQQLKKKITLDLVDFLRLHTNDKQEFRTLDVLYELF